MDRFDSYVSTAGLVVNICPDNVESYDFTSFFCVVVKLGFLPLMKKITECV
jgi:hypothetical protein